MECVYGSDSTSLDLLERSADRRILDSRASMYNQSGLYDSIQHVRPILTVADGLTVA